MIPAQAYPVGQGQFWENPSSQMGDALSLLNSYYEGQRADATAKTDRAAKLVGSLGPSAISSGRMDNEGLQAMLQAAGLGGDMSGGMPWLSPKQETPEGRLKRIQGDIAKLEYEGGILPKTIATSTIGGSAGTMGGRLGTADITDLIKSYQETFKLRNMTKEQLLFAAQQEYDQLVQDGGSPEQVNQYLIDKYGSYLQGR